MYLSYYKSLLGLIRIKASKESITAINFVENRVPKEDNEIIFEFSDIKNESHTSQDSMPVYLKNCMEQLNAYFEGNRKYFDFPLALKGTNFQLKVWHKLLSVEYGKTASYKDIAKVMADVKSVRAVGSANGLNPIAIVVPCHRIIGADGSLTGYAGGLWRKKWLLEHEKKYAGFDRQMSLF